MSQPGLHHIALVCKDVVETHRFYHDLLGLELVHSEETRMKNGYLRHFFYDLGDGSCIAFFDLHGVGEPEEFDPAISTGLGLPAWVNHVAIRSTPERTAAAVARFEAAGEKPEMHVNHGWCDSTYFKDPMGNLIELCIDAPGFDPDPEQAARQLLQAS
ncbi:MAG: VOC family protein [Ilumatobacteraceae bacterium]